MFDVMMSLKSVTSTESVLMVFILNIYLIQ